MKLEIYRRDWNIQSSVEYTTILNGVLMEDTRMERLFTPIEVIDEAVINMMLHKLSNNIDETVERVINGKKAYNSNLICVYSSSDNKLLKELEVKLKMKEIEEDF